MAVIAGEALRRPEWHGAPIFNQCWRQVAQLMGRMRNSERDVERLSGCGNSLHAARVIKIDWSYVELLPAPGESPPMLPFENVFIEFAGRDGAMNAILAEQLDDSGDGAFDADGACSSFIGFVDGLPMFSAGRHDGEWFFDAFFAGVQMDEGERRVIFSDAYDALLRVMYLLQSANVGLETETLPRQQRRSAERTRARIPLVIAVRRAKRRPGRGVSAAANYSHQFEVAAHYQHHTRGPLFDRCKDPAKRLTIDGIECVRVWDPGCIKGPADAPFIPKVRRVVNP